MKCMLAVHSIGMTADRRHVSCSCVSGQTCSLDRPLSTADTHARGLDLTSGGQSQWSVTAAILQAAPRSRIRQHVCGVSGGHAAAVAAEHRYMEPGTQASRAQSSLLCMLQTHL